MRIIFLGLAKQPGGAALCRGAVLCSILFFASLSVAQPWPDTLWTGTYGGSWTDWAYDIQLTSDGGYIIAGYSSSSSSGGAYLVRLDAMGDTLWTRGYRGIGCLSANAIAQTTDGGYVFAGESLLNPVLVKTDGVGNVVWAREYEGIYGDPQEGEAVCQTSDGGYIMAADGGVGYFPDIALIKTDTVGDTLWTRQFGGERRDTAPALQQTQDGGYILGGSTFSPGGTLDFYLVRTDENGDTVWTRTYGGVDDERGRAIDLTSDGGYIIAGGTERLDHTDDMYVVKTDGRGDTMWTRTYGGPDIEAAYGIEQTGDGGYIIVGHTLSYGAGWADFYLVKIDSLGDTLWTRTYGGPGTDFGLSLQQTSDGGYIMAGWTSSFGAGGWDIYVVKTGPDIAAVDLPRPLPTTIVLDQNYPNPFNATTRIAFDLPKAGPMTLRVYDLLGREVVTLVDGVRAAGHYSVQFDGSGLASGIYFYRLETGGGHEVKKMVMLK